MTRIKHTRGPVHVFNEFSYSWIGVAVHGQTGFSEVAKIYGHNHKADATLLAAVWDLFDVCLELLPMVELHRGCECGGNLPDDLSAWAGPLANLKAAIAKATGAAC